MSAQNSNTNDWMLEVSEDDLEFIPKFERSAVYYKMLLTLGPDRIRLSPHDDRVYKRFRELFPDFKIDVLDIGQVYDTGLDAKMCAFHLEFKDDIADYLESTIIRIDHNEMYKSKNLILVSRLMFHAIEIARNREGCNKFSNYKQ